jgi:phosphoribosylformylglycinamidine cyclo-ligase
MGAGFALYVAAADARRTVEVARAAGIGAWVAGEVVAGPKRVAIEPIGVTYGGDELQLR